MRFKPSETIGFLAPPTLDDLIQRYAVYKSELDNYKKLSEEDNLEIKRLMVEANITEYTAGGYTAKYVVSTSESMDEDKLIDVIKKHNYPGIIKTKEYVDMDALESYLYNAKLSDDETADLDKCRIVKEKVQLRLTKAKKKKEEE